MELSKHKKVFAIYLLLQAIIWIKSFFFFQWFGHGQVAVLRLNLPDNILLADTIFHQTMHILILICAFSFGRNLSEIDDKKLLAIVIAAAIIHNCAYWATSVFETVLSAGIDLATDTFTLFAVIILSSYLEEKHEFFRKTKIPLLD